MADAAGTREAIAYALFEKILTHERDVERGNELVVEPRQYLLSLYTECLKAVTSAGQEPSGWGSPITVPPDEFNPDDPFGG